MKNRSIRKQRTQNCCFEKLEERQHFSVYTVTNAVDGQRGSLREIIEYANAHPSPTGDQIDFAVGANRGQVSLSFNPSLGALPAITDKVDIEGETQDPAIGEPVTLVGRGLTLRANGDIVNEIRVSTSSFGLNVQNCGGVTIENSSFVLSGNNVAIELENSSYDTVQHVSALGNGGGCALFVTGTSQSDSFWYFNETKFGSGVQLGAGTVSNTFYYGSLQLNSDNGAVDAGNGNAFADVSILSNHGDGLYECGANETLQSDTFQFNGANGIEFGVSPFNQSQTNNGFVWGNSIAENGANGILVDGQDRLYIGQPVGNSNADSNTIWDNTANGIKVLADTEPVTISDNSIFANGGLGIDLAEGSNALANAPVLTSVTYSDGLATITGTEVCQPGQQMTLQFFVSDYGSSNEGDTLIGQWVGTGTPETSNPGISTFSVTFSTSNILGEPVTATSQSPQSSAFSNAETASQFYPPILGGPIIHFGPHLI